MIFRKRTDVALSKTRAGSFRFNAESAETIGVGRAGLTNRRRSVVRSWGLESVGVDQIEVIEFK